MVCISTPSFSLAINGSIHGFFKGKRGLRQGDPLSPLLFVICLEYLSRALKVATNNLDFNYHPKCGPLKITHLAFADDLMLFARGDSTSIFGGSISCRKIESHPLRPFFDKIATYIHAWTIRSVSQGVECFWLSIFPMPTAVSMRITRLCRNFLWNSKKLLVAWSEVCLPKSEGGLGFRDIKCWNNALLAKSLWNVHAKKDTLWVQWINHVYLRGTSIWERSPKKDDSLLLKKMMSIAQRMKEVEGSNHAAYQRISGSKEIIYGFLKLMITFDRRGRQLSGQRLFGVHASLLNIPSFFGLA
ncbi:uncharacterized protein LOC111373749 [Olea europaea var. sylvestris]|uniref:uncharacterized protein LOC111373749 n=1 Tax=Olea europaea var. sylvestris TaxID=158386 RepID=UPI000C1D3029|nr:uncharacterized protein LOC111373749 [Olea europaea var. sylvestris]